MRLSISIVPLLSAALAIPGPAFAQTVLEEIVVSARKREQSLQDVPLSITAFGADDFRDLTRGTLDGLAAQVPNLQAYATNSFLQSVHIRGIGLNEFQGQYDSPVAQHIDEVYISKPWMVARRKYDIERVEVLKGPQGTLFGRNTTGGALNYYTAPPTSEFDAAIGFAADEHERYRLDGMINGPLGEQLSGRLSFNTEFGNGGPQYNEYTGDEHGTPDVYDFRGQLLWEGDKASIRTMVHGGRDQSEKIAWKGPGIFNLGAPGYCPQALSGAVYTNPSLCPKFAGFAALGGNPEGEFEPNNAHRINQNTPPEVDDSFYGGYLRISYDLGWAELTSISAGEYYERVHREDTQSDIFDSTSTHYYNEMMQLTQELRLVGTYADRLHYVTGLFYQRDDLDQYDGSDLSAQPIPGITPPFADQFFASFNQKLQSYAAFANMQYELSDALSVDFGLRYSNDTTEVDDVLLGLGNLPQRGKEKNVTPCLITTYVNGPVGSTDCPFLGPIAPAFADDRTDDNTSWLLGLQWKPADDILVYGNLTTGYRAGGYSLPFAGAATSFEPEEIFAQELGVKSRWAEGRVQLNMALFHFSYDDVQVNVDDPVSPLVPITRNIGEQENWGAELEFEWRPTAQWMLRQSVGWLDAEYQDTDRVITTYAGPVALDGMTPVNSPEYTYNGLVQFTRPVFADWDMALNFDYRWVDDRYLETTNQKFDQAEDYWVANVRAGASSPDGHWNISVYCTNLFDEEYITYINNLGFFALQIFGERRTVGTTLSYRFR